MCLDVDRMEVSRAEVRASEMGFVSRPQLIGTGSTGLVSARLNLAGGAKRDEQRKPASLFCCPTALSLGKKIECWGCHFLTTQR